MYNFRNKTFVGEVLSSSLEESRKVELIHMAYTDERPETFTPEMMIFILKHGLDLSSDILNDIIIPLGNEDVYKYLPSLENAHISLSKVAETISTTRDDWKKKRLIDDLVKILHTLDERESEALYLDFIKYGGEPDQIPEMAGIKDEIDPEIIKKARIFHKAFGTPSTKIPEHIKSWKIVEDISVMTLEDDTITISDSTDHKTTMTRRQFSRTNLKNRITRSYSYTYSDFYDDTSVCSFDELHVVHTDGKEFSYP